MDHTTQDNTLRFEPFTSSVDLSFWYELSRRKLDLFRLSEDAVPLNGFYNLGCIGACQSPNGAIPIPYEYFFESLHPYSFG